MADGIGIVYSGMNGWSLIYQGADDATGSYDDVTDVRQPISGRVRHRGARGRAPASTSPAGRGS
jgi:hypothetical protein